MALDRLVYWKKKKPTDAELTKVLDDYVSGAGRVERRGKRLFAVLRGKPRFPFRSLKETADFAGASEVHDERWFEVYMDEKNADIITRQQDHFTNAVAEGFTELIAQFWAGRRSDT